MFALGDFNICINENTNESKLLIDSMKLCNLKQIINESTRLGSTKISTLDHIYTNSQNIIAKGTGILNISDHLLVYVTRKKAKSCIKKEYIFKRKIVNEKIVDFKADLVKHDWSDIYSMNCTNKIWNRMVEVISLYADRYFPIKKYRKKPKIKIWLTHEIQKEIENKNMLLLKAKK